MATKTESEYPSSPTNDGSDGEVDNEEDKFPSNNNVADILKRLQSSGALIKKPKQEYHCFTCDEDFVNWPELEQHLIQHVSLPSVVLEKLQSDDEDAPSGDENWSEEDEPLPPSKAQNSATPQKIDISQILKKTGISIKKPEETTPEKNSQSALTKLSGLGFTIKKNNTPIKKEPELELESECNNDVLQRLGKLGGIKLKLKSDGGNKNSFKVINGLKDFKASDDEEENSENEYGKDEQDAEFDQDNNKSAEEPIIDSVHEPNISGSRKLSESNETDKSQFITKKNNVLKDLQGKSIVSKEIITQQNKPAVTNTQNHEVQQQKPPSRPAIKQTPKRGVTLPILGKEIQQSREGTLNQSPRSSIHTPERRQSNDLNMENIYVKKEVETKESDPSSVPLFSGQIKSERASPPPIGSTSSPVIARVKSEPDCTPVTSSQPIFTSQSSNSSVPLLTVAKKEDTGMTIIEINGDSNDEDDDCCVVSSTPAPDIKPVIPKTENPTPSYPPPSYPTSQSYSSTSNILSARLPAPSSTEKQHNFNWNAPDSKPTLDILDKSTDEIFESLLSSATKKENLSLSDASEYISLDTLGPQHSCEVCNTRFTNISLLEEHKRVTGHSNTLVAPSSSSLMPFNSSNILSSLLPVKQLTDQVGKLSAIGGSGPGFTHQQNVMINIQAYPGSSGLMGPPQYNAYPPQGQNMGNNFPQAANNMYGVQGQMPGQYPSQHYMGQQQGYGQFQAPMSKSGYPSNMPPSSFPSTPYSTASPLQSMQQAVYGQTSTGMINPQVNQMGPLASSPNHPYAPSLSPSGSMKPPTSSGIRIQNVQTFPPGQSLGMHGSNDASPGGQVAPGQVVGGQMPSPNQIRLAPGANVSSTRPRMPGTRGPRPPIRAGIHVQGQMRGAKPGGVRMPIERPGMVTGGPGQKRRTDMLLPGKHDNEDCHVMSMQKQRDGLPLIQSVQGAKDKLNLGSQISITKKTVNKEANAMANVLASRGISIKQKQKSRSPTPERPIPHIPNLGAGVSIKHTSKSSNFSIPEAKVGGGMQACKICKRMFANYSSLQVHMANAHPQAKIPIFKCEDCPASYPKILQLQHHKRVFHNVSGPNRELGLPVVDLSQEENLKRLSSLGIYSFIPLASREQTNGCFGIPVISVHNMQNGLTNSLQALGADGLLSLGPLKPLPNS